MMFLALESVYSEDIFSNLLRFRVMFFAWSAAFCLLLFMHQALEMFGFMEGHLLALWFFVSLLADLVRSACSFCRYSGAGSVPGSSCKCRDSRWYQKMACAWPSTCRVTATFAPSDRIHR